MFDNCNKKWDMTMHWLYAIIVTLWFLLTSIVLFINYRLSRWFPHFTENDKLKLRRYLQNKIINYIKMKWNERKKSFLKILLFISVRKWYSSKADKKILLLKERFGRKIYLIFENILEITLIFLNCALPPHFGFCIVVN